MRKPISSNTDYLFSIQTKGTRLAFGRFQLRRHGVYMWGSSPLSMFIDYFRLSAFRVIFCFRFYMPCLGVLTGYVLCDVYAYYMFSFWLLGIYKIIQYSCFI